MLDAQFEWVLALGLAEALRPDPWLNLIPSSREDDNGRDAGPPAPEVMILDDTGDRPASCPSLASATGVILFTRKPSLHYGTVLLEAGVSCLATSTAPEAIREAVHLTASGRNVFCSVDGDRVEHTRRLTEREIQVLIGLSAGRGYRAIAAALDIGPGTVRKHTENLLPKVAARTRKDLTGLPMAWFSAPRSSARVTATGEYE